MTSWRERILGNLERGDLLFATTEGGQGMIMLIREVTPETILTRHVPSQIKIEFDRNGRSGTVEELGVCTILSAAPLPADWYAVVFGLDRKIRLMHSLEHIRLTEGEKDLLREVGDFYKSRPLPDD